MIKIKLGSRSKALRAVLTGALVMVGTPSFAAPDQTQIDALNSLFTNLNGVNWVDNTGWNTNTDPCAGWFGVTCDGAGANVTELNLQDNRLVGVIPPDIVGLDSLRVLVLQNNSLGGTSIPLAIGSMLQLQELYLNDAGFQGSIPAELGQLTNLRTLALDDNVLSGPIPVEFGNLVNLINLRLYGNHLTGPIPESVGNLTGLKNLGLHRNALVGIIPSSLVNLSELQTMSLDWNALYSTDGTLNTFINQRADSTWATTDYIDTQTLDAATRPAVIGESAIRLIWDQRNTTPPTEGGYKIYQALAAEGPYTLLKKVPLKQSSSTFIDNLTPSTTYFYEVRSYSTENPFYTLPADLESDGNFYDPLEVTTLAAGSGNTGVDTTPDAADPVDSGNGDTGGINGGTDDGSSGGGGGGGTMTYLLLALFGFTPRRARKRKTA